MRGQATDPQHLTHKTIKTVESAKPYGTTHTCNIARRHVGAILRDSGNFLNSLIFLVRILRHLYRQNVFPAESEFAFINADLLPSLAPGF